MGFVHRHRGEPAVEQMAPPATAGIDEIRPPAMGRAEGEGQAVLAGAAEDQVNMVGHQAIGPDLDRGLAHLLGEQVAIDLLVAVFEEDRFRTVTLRRDVVGKTWDDDASAASHALA